MSTARVGFVAGAVAGIAVGLGAGAAAERISGTVGANLVVAAQASQKSSSTIVLENAKIRVKDATFAPGDKAPGMHTHELAHVGVVISGGKLVFRYPDGKSETLDLPAGGVGYRDANVTHEAVNPGSATVRVIEVELK